MLHLFMYNLNNIHIKYFTCPNDLWQIQLKVALFLENYTDLW